MSAKRTAGAIVAAWSGTIRVDGQVVALCRHRHAAEDQARDCAARELRSPGGWAFAERLYELRKQAGKTMEEVAELLECSLSKVNRIESGAVRPHPREVRDLLDLYGVDGSEREQLIQAARDQRERRSPSAGSGGA